MAKATLKALDHQVKYIKLQNFYSTSINQISPTVEIRHSLPFRVKFTSINIEGYSSSNPPPIPIQVIGYSNYIL